MAKAKSAAASASAEQLSNKKPAVKKSDVLAGVAAEVESLSQKKSFELVDELSQSGGLSDFRLGGVLAHIQSEAAKEGGEAWLDGHKTVRDLWVSRFNIMYRKANYLINIYTNLVEKQIPWDVVKDLGWMKLAYLAPVLTPKNVEAWAKKAEKMTVLQLQEAIKKTKGNATEAEASSVGTMTFKVHKDQRDAIRAGLDKGKKETKTDVDTVALFNIMQAYLGNAVKVELEPGAEVEKPKGKAKLTAFHKERLAALLKEANDDLGGEEGAFPNAAQVLVDVFEKQWPDITLKAEF